jgi:hypothetical protein
MYCYVKRFQITCVILGSKRTGGRHIVSKNKLDKISAKLETSPRVIGLICAVNGCVCVSTVKCNKTTAFASI